MIKHNLILFVVSLFALFMLTGCDSPEQTQEQVSPPLDAPVVEAEQCASLKMISEDPIYTLADAQALFGGNWQELEIKKVGNDCHLKINQDAAHFSPIDIKVIQSYEFALESPEQLPGHSEYVSGIGESAYFVWDLDRSFDDSAIIILNIKQGERYFQLDCSKPDPTGRTLTIKCSRDEYLQIGRIIIERITSS